MKLRSLTVGLALGLASAACGRAAGDGRGDVAAVPGGDDPGSSPGAAAAEDAGPPNPWQGLPGARLDPLPPPRSARTDTFMTSDECAFCHAAQAGSAALRDAKGRDVSPSALWRGSMMALAARDPYYLAVLEHELAAHPGAEATILKTCTRCHAPAANVELATAGGHLSFTDLTHGEASEALVGRDGVTCSLCHQIEATGLGTPASFTGRFVVGASRQIFGPHQAPLTMPMQQRVGYTPTASGHMQDSGLCGTCHTVVTRSLDAQGVPSGPELLEQGPFVEWSVSSFAKPGGQTCQSCHVPTTDEEGAALATVLSTRPMNNLSPRSPFGRHELTGANAFMLRVLARERSWAGIDAIPAEELLAHAARAEASLRSAARLSLASVAREAADLVVRVRVENLTGHKLPTAYPSRRMWLHVRIVDDAGRVVFESGAHRGGRIVDASGAVLDGKGRAHAHRTTIASSAEVQIWEAIPADAAGRVATTLLDATSYLKDDRVLPAGFDAADARSALARPAGVDGDADFVPGSDEVLVRVAGAPATGRVEVALLYQTTRPAELEVLAEHPGPAALRFLDMIGPDAMTPIALAKTTAALP